MYYINLSLEIFQRRLQNDQTGFFPPH